MKTINSRADNIKRLFIGIKIEPDDNLVKTITSIRSQLVSESIKWVNPRNIHITLAFLGDIEERKITAISEILNAYCPGTGPFDIVFKGIGVFKDIRNPRVIWLGIRQNVILAELSRKITSVLRTKGFTLEERSFRPHLTIGRVRSLSGTEGIKNVLEEYGEKEIQRSEVREVTLFESILLKTGAEYRVLAQFLL